MANTANQSPSLACTLTDAELRERRATMRRILLPHVLACHSRDLELTMNFPNRESIREELDAFVDFERRCCAFLDFSITSTGENLLLTISGPDGSESTIRAFAEATGHAGE